MKKPQFFWLLITILSVTKIQTSDDKIQLFEIIDNKEITRETPLLFDKKITKQKLIVESISEKTDLAKDIENLLKNWQQTETESRNVFYCLNSGSILFSTVSTILSLTNNSFTKIGYSAALRGVSSVLNIVGTAKIVSNRNARRGKISSFVHNFIKNNFSGMTSLENNKIDEFYTQVQNELKKIYKNCPPRETLLKIAFVLNSLGSTVLAAREFSHHYASIKNDSSGLISGMINLVFCVTNTVAYTISLCRCSCEDGPSAKEKFIRNLELLLNKYKTTV